MKLEKQTRKREEESEKGIKEGAATVGTHCVREKGTKENVI